MAKDKKPQSVRAGSQGARILNALQNGRWISVAEIQRRAGNSRLNSRVSELRKRGYKIEHRVVKGKERASLAHQYRLLDKPEVLPDPGPPLVQDRDPLDRDSTPRTKENQYRIYIVDERNNLLLMSTASTEEQVGVEIFKLGRSGKISKACLGILDTYGKDKEVIPGTWIVNPYDGKIL